MDISVIFPAHNEESTISEAIKRTFYSLKKNGYTSEIVVIDDGSTDKTGKIVDSLGKKFRNLIVIHNKSKIGKAASLDRGFDKASGKILVMMDADLQQIPEEIPLLLEKISQGYDVVNGWRKNRKDPWTKTFPSKIYNFMARILFKVPTHDMNCGFKAFRREVIDNIILRPDYFRYIVALAQQEGYKVTEVPITHYKRFHGKSKFGVTRFVAGFDLVSIKMREIFSRRPMLLFGGLGILALIVGLISGFYLAYLKLVNGELINNHISIFFLTTIGIVGGIAMISMGFVADLIKDVEYKIEKLERKK